MANSLAIMTDAAHLLSDVAGFTIALMAAIMSDLPATKNFTYGLLHAFRFFSCFPSFLGMARAEVLGAVLSTCLIWALTGALVYEAIIRAKSFLFFYDF